jgi:two-component system sensor histidine kinase KdpD
VGLVALSAIMVPLRGHLSVATTALVLVVPVVAGVAVGGFGAGLVAVAAGFLLYDYLFIPPYGTLSVGEAQNWAALGVYVLVMLLVARVVSSLQRARAEARDRERDARNLFELTDLLIAERSVPELAAVVARTTERAFGPRWVAVLLPADDDRLRVVATAGDPLSDEERRRVVPVGGRPEGMGRMAHPAAAGREGIWHEALATGAGPVGILALCGPALDGHRRSLLRAYANQAAVALERARLGEEAQRARALEEADRWRSALMGAVSHDLRTPLATVKAAVTTLRGDGELSPADQAELLELIDLQADALDRLVANLLDMTRIEAGALRLDRGPIGLDDLVAQAVRTLGPTAPPLHLDLPDEAPPLEVDRVLMAQVMANLLQNAARHSPAGRPVDVSARWQGDQVTVSVRDRGPGVAPEDRERIFQLFSPVGGSGRAGLGLAIARAFVEAHGGTLSVQDAPGGGARFVVHLPAAPTPAHAA